MLIGSKNPAFMLKHDVNLTAVLVHRDRHRPLGIFPKESDKNPGCQFPLDSLELVGGLEHEFFDFPYIGNFIIPSDELHHFSEG